MKSIYLVRHANAGWSNSNTSDFERTLSERGRLEADEMARRFVVNESRPDLIVSSPASRALETAEIFAEVLGYDPESIRREAAIYSGDIDTLEGIVKELPKELDSVMIFGHNPTISLYASWLTGRHIGQMETCGVLRLALEKKKWKDARKGSAKAVWYQQPKRRQ